MNNVFSRGRSLIARERLPASYTKGGLQLTDTFQKYKRLSIDASYKILKNYFFQQGDLLSNILEHLLPDSLRYDGSKGLKKCIDNLNGEIDYLKPGLIYLEKQVRELEMNKAFMTGSSLISSQFTMLFNRPSVELKELLKHNNIKTIGHMISYYNENSHEIDPNRISELESIVLPLKAKFGEFEKYMPDTHTHMILHGFPKNKQFRPKYLIKEEYDNSLDEKFEEPPALKTRDRDKTLNITKEQYAYCICL